MNNLDPKKELILYRLNQAKEMLSAAKALADTEVSPRSIINRAYYAMFYSVLAILATIDKGSAKHSGVISLFNQHFIKTDILPKELGKILHNAFDFRQEADYGTDTIAVSNEVALEILADAQTFVEVINTFITQG